MTRGSGHPPVARCWECSQRNGHAATGGEHPDWWCKPDACPDRAEHAEQVYGKRLTSRYGGMTRDGVTIIQQIDDVDAAKTHNVERCVCGLLLIWKPKCAKRANNRPGAPS